MKFIENIPIIGVSAFIVLLGAVLYMIWGDFTLGFKIASTSLLVMTILRMIENANNN